MTRPRLAAALVVAVLATLPAAPVSAEDPPAPEAAIVADVEDDLLQIMLTRLVEEAPEFGSFLACPSVGGTCDAARNVAISVIRLDDGAHAEVNGDIWEVSASAAKAYWVAAAVDRVGPAAVESLAESIFVSSSNNAASAVIDLVGPQPSDGVDLINEYTRGWGLDDTFLRGWYGDRYSSETPYPWGLRNITTTDDLAAFWAGVGNVEMLDAPDTAEFMEWAALPRPSTNELIVPRLPDAAATYYKSGWLRGDIDNPSRRRLGGALITPPSGAGYAIGIAFQARTNTTFYDTGIRFSQYASCEVYNLIAGTDRTCTRTGDPYEIISHTTAPIGALTMALAERDQLRVGGWALDRDAGADPINVKITVDGGAVGTIVADQLKTSVHDLHGLGNYHGFKATLDVELSPGDHQVCAVAVNDSEAGSNRTIGCKTVTVSEDHPPVGNLATARVKKDRVIAGGWAKDADTEGPIEVKITLDGNRLRLIQADRGDGGHGFWLSVSTPLSTGDHEICAIAQNFEDGGPNRTIGCETVTVPDDWPPGGTLIEATAQAHEVWVRGRAWDEDTTDPIEVLVEVDGSPVGSVMSYRGTVNRKYNDTLPLTPAIDPGPHEVCTIAVNHTGGEPTTPLGCLTVVVPDV